MPDKNTCFREGASLTRLKYPFSLSPVSIFFRPYVYTWIFLKMLLLQSKSTVSGNVNVNFVFETNIFISHSNDSILSQNLRQGAEYQERKLNISESAIGSETMNDILQGYKNHLCGAYTNKNTRKNKCSCVKNFLKFTDDAVSKESLLKWRQWANGHYTHNSLNANLQRINEFLKWLGKPDDFKMKLVGWIDANKSALTENEIEQLKNGIDKSELKLIFYLLFDGIRRPAELINIKVCDKKKDELYLYETKTGNHHIILSLETQKAWNDYLKERPTPKPKYKDYLLIQKDFQYVGEKFHTPQAIAKKIKKLGKKIGLIQSISPYTIKRTAITLRLDPNSKYYVGNAKIVQTLASHKDLSQTYKYDRTTDDDIRKYFQNQINSPKNRTDSQDNQINPSY